MALANVTLLNTFFEWMTRTNQIIYKVDQIENANITFTSNSSNALSISGRGNLSSNVYLTIRTSNNVNDIATANIASANLVNTVHEVARAAFAAANTGTTLSAAFTQANNAHTHANTAHATANAAFEQANSAVADIGTQLGPAYTQANTARTHANTAHITGNAAFTQANTACTHAGAAHVTANAAFNKANSANYFAYLVNSNTTAAFAKANTNYTIAVSAFARANLQPANGTANSYEFRLGTSSSHALTPASVWDTNAVIVSGATIAIDFSQGFDFSGSGNAPLALGINATLNFPSNLKTGQKGIIWFSASGSTRTLTLNASYKLMEGVETGPYSIAVNALLGLAYVVNGSNVYITSVLRRSSI